ncbi:MAG: Transcriptional regulator, MerR family [Ilumatobacteraceae bacterium]|nr:Transcriptional regulator, MerR family [Ilumatobacteraceae bacterium]MCU1387411.1 Transcriptional regulator, MerR family [Ilumatobacteraceae bacterium]
MNTHQVDDHEELTIDALAQRSGVVVSTVRLYQNKGLLPPPTKRGRIGYYASGHLQRLQAIGRLQERGFSLAGIKELLDGVDSGESLRDVLGVESPTWIWSAEAPQTMTFAELAAQLPSLDLTPALVQRVVQLGLVELAPDGTHVIVHSPAFLKIGSALTALGIPAADVLDEYEWLRAEADAIAARFTDLFRRRMWKPFAKRGMPADQIPPLLATLEQLAPLAEDVTVVALRHALQGAADSFLRSEASRLGVAITQPGTKEHQP